ncbi:hypothetical protein [Deinococcus metallilatus]|uniref:Uncharacterized protein n=1 Tax=Deinococcus metallilatus TaxID=1211322 RepID=A0ABR6MS58_9DEIO|nr:hypothetical protein [Deinococcus metallilatus]MBB5294549.1 hypothetical protein [Deinococcus metallilatus]GMA15762.1 hypothetical protein GCM10025871_20930 [Deinococcus metallilatus]
MYAPAFPLTSAPIPYSEVISLAYWVLARLIAKLELFPGWRLY